MDTGNVVRRQQETLGKYAEVMRSESVPLSITLKDKIKYHKDQISLLEDTLNLLESNKDIEKLLYLLGDIH